MLIYKRKLILTKNQEERISSWIGVCRLVYNMGLEIRIAAYKTHRKSIHKYALMRELKTIKDIDWIKDVPAQSLCGVIDRLDNSYKHFFRRGCVGFPHFASKKTYKSILLKEGVHVRANNRIQIPKIGLVKIFKDAEIIGRFSCEIPDLPLLLFFYLPQYHDNRRALYCQLSLLPNSFYLFEILD